MFLIDTDVVSELRKRTRMNMGVVQFFSRFIVESDRCYVSAITIGELRQGVERVRHRGDTDQAHALGSWLSEVGQTFASRILPVDQDVAEVWGALRVPDSTNSIDKLIAATALVNSLTVVTRNIRHYEQTGAVVLNPFT